MDLKTLKKGDKLYVPSKVTAQYGDSIIGGIATINNIRHLSDGSYATMDETDKIQWKLDHITKQQDQLKKEFGDKRAEISSEPFERSNFIW